MFSEIIGFDFNFPPEYLRAALILSLLSVWVLVGLFFYLNLYTRRRYFSLWTAAWMFYSLWLTLCIAITGENDHPLVSMIKHWCISASAVCLLWGSSVFHNLKSRQVMFGLFIVFLFVWSYIGSIHFESLLLTQLPVFALIGGASLMTAWAFYKFRLRRDYVGAGLLAIGFLFWGIYLAGYPIFTRVAQLASSLFLISAVLQLFIAVSMIILVLEEVRSSNKLAFQQLRSQKTERAVLQKKVASTEERYRRLFDQAHEGIVIVAAEDLRLLEMNLTARQLLGTGSPAGKTLLLPNYLKASNEQDPVPPPGPDWSDWVSRHHLLNIVRPDGTVTPVEMDGAHIELEGREAFQFFFRELTERTRLEQQLRQAERLSTVGQMISGIAHELNNPLSVIMGYLELVIKRHDLSPQTRLDLQKVAQESNRAVKLVNNFLSLAREQKDDRECVDLNNIIHLVIELRQPELRIHGIMVQLDLDPALPKTVASADQVQQVLVNLVNNAMQAMAKNTVPGDLRISSQVGEGKLQLRVADTGPGVPQSLRAKMFEPFFTTKEVGTGTGLGLSIAHNIMADHSGRIIYEEAPGGGACFLIEFPIVAESAAVLKPTPGFDIQFEEKPKTEPTPRTARILVLDDEKSIADMLGEMLNLLGHETTVCNSGLQALKELDRREYDLVLTDFRMPIMNGQEFYNAATERHAGMRERIVFLTGDVVNEQTKAFLDSVGATYLGKPFHLDKVESIINQILNHSSPAALN